jgi:NAD(P)-dependent dehydrogenase (short-subunit alcohol dehydrogenase family)
MDTGLANRVTFVSGASRGIGREIAIALGAEGARVAVGWHSGQTEAELTVERIIAAGGMAVAVQLDQGDPESIAEAIRATEAAFGPVEVLVANAVSWPNRSVAEPERLALSMNENVVGSFRLIDLVLPGMRQAKWGRVVLISSDIVAQPTSGDVAYAAAKGALESIAHVLAVREARNGILTNIVRPGFTLTEKADDIPRLADVAVSEAQSTPTGRVSVPADVASAVVYLASASNTHVNGQTVSIAGGRELQR